MARGAIIAAMSLRGLIWRCHFRAHIVCWRRSPSPRRQLRHWRVCRDVCRQNVRLLRTFLTFHSHHLKHPLQIALERREFYAEELQFRSLTHFMCGKVVEPRYKAVASREDRSVVYRNFPTSTAEPCFQKVPLNKIVGKAVSQRSCSSICVSCQCGVLRRPCHIRKLLGTPRTFGKQTITIIHSARRCSHCLAVNWTCSNVKQMLS